MAKKVKKAEEVKIEPVTEPVVETVTEPTVTESEPVAEKVLLGRHPITKEPVYG